MRIYIGHDAREEEAYRVCVHSLTRRASVPLDVRPLGQPAGLYRRPWRRAADGQRVDDGDGRPFSTDFAFSRFLVPALLGYAGWALYCDCDFLFLEDVARLWALRDGRYAVQCVQHDHRPREARKMDGQVQSVYARKNWSSLVLWNGGHPAHRVLTVEAVNTRPGAWLHGFRWLADAEIGALPLGWNWLDGWSPAEVPAHAVHFTGGGPWFAGHVPGPYTAAWQAEREALERGSAGPAASGAALRPADPG